jgi:acyl dehydratase
MSPAAIPALGTIFDATPLAVIDAAQVHAYAQASGDRNQIHLDDTAARRAGLPGAIVHGMLMMGRLEAAIAAWLPGHRIISLQTRFVRPLAVGGAMSVSGRIAKRDGDAAILRLVMRDGDGQNLCIGEAEITPGA